MAQLSKFSRAPLLRTFSGDCPAHGPVSRSEVEQFDGSVLIRECKHCQWEALHTLPVNGETHQQAQARAKAERLNAALVGSGITPRFAGCTLDNYRTEGCPSKTKALETCRGYVDQFEANYQAGRSLILVGNVGTGKTHLASGIAQALIRQYGASALIVSASEIFRVARGAMAPGAGYTDRDVLAELAGVDLLLIDEVGAQKGSEFELGLLHEVIDRRYQLLLPTVVISNLTTEELQRFVGDRALDRLRQNGGLLAGFTWDSMRARA